MPESVSDADIQHKAILEFVKAVGMLAVLHPERSQKSYMDVSVFSSGLAIELYCMQLQEYIRIHAQTYRQAYINMYIDKYKFIAS
jgi:hypothetical protein